MKALFSFVRLSKNPAPGLPRSSRMTHLQLQGSGPVTVGAEGGRVGATTKAAPAAKAATVATPTATVKRVMLFP